MRKVIYETEIKRYSYSANENNEAIAETKALENFDTFTELHIFADEGKVFRRISTGEILTAHIGVGSNDNVNDFEEIANIL